MDNTEREREGEIKAMEAMCIIYMYLFVGRSNDFFIMKFFFSPLCATVDS